MVRTASVVAIATLAAGTATHTRAQSDGEPFTLDRLAERMQGAAAKPYPANLPHSGEAIEPKTLILPGVTLRTHQTPRGAGTFSLFVVSEGLSTPAPVISPEVTGFTLTIAAPNGKPFEAAKFLADGSFRLAGQGNIFGVASYTVAVGGEEQALPTFPRLTQIYIEASDDGAALVVYAGAEHEKLTAALRMEFALFGDATTVQVTSRIFFREDVAQLGIAPLASMFLFGAANRGAFDDFRPQVHKSDGLWFRRDNLVSWRPLTNPPLLANSYIGMEGPNEFGLLQRAIEFESYQDNLVSYERMPSLVIAPATPWGDGFIRLIERPTLSEQSDNVLAFWLPRRTFAAGENSEFSYSLRASTVDPDNADLAYVAQTRAGAGGVSGVENATDLRKFVIDFQGQPLRQENLHNQVDAFVTISRGSVVHTALSRLPSDDRMRLVIDADIEGSEPVELRAYLIGNGKQLSESWLYQWRRSQ